MMLDVRKVKKRIPRAICFVSVIALLFAGRVYFQKGISADELLSLEPAQISDMGIAKLNLLCSRGLPHTSKDVDIDDCLVKLNEWTKLIKLETEQNMDKYYRTPHSFNNSEAYFRALVLVTVLDRDVGVKYNMKLVRSGVMSNASNTKFFRDSQDVFLSGLLSARREGSCSSMPVLIVSIGRKLGYPLKLVPAKGHLFARWESDDGKDLFNIDSSGNGLVVNPDEFYKRWPHPVSDAEVAQYGFLKSLTPVEELAVFLELRGLCLLENGREDEAVKVFERVIALRPQSMESRKFLAIAQRRSKEDKS